MSDFDPIPPAALQALREIARGRTPSNPLYGPQAREIARRALITCGDDWTARGTAGRLEAPLNT
jgi:hypothetical protein